MHSRSCSNDECEQVDYAEDVDLMPGEVVRGSYYCEDCVDEAKRNSD